eukprot:12913588-Prorocentrum_lima.AAC.1
MIGCHYTQEGQASPLSGRAGSGTRSTRRAMCFTLNLKHLPGQDVTVGPKFLFRTGIAKEQLHTV